MNAPCEFANQAARTAAAVVRPAADGDPADPPDAACTTVAQDGALLASCSLWWRRTPRLAGRRTGLIGQYFSADAQAGARLLDRACSELAARDCEVAVGPMNGSTWGEYRFAIAGSVAPRFCMEPHNHADWPLQFQRAGFNAIAHYRSALQTDLALEDTRLGRVAERIGAAGIHIRCIDTRRFDEELERMHALVMAGFRDSLFFTPLRAEEFVRRHRRLLPCILQELVLIAEQAGRPVALLFAIPDLAQAQRGEPIDTAIVKTVVALPGRVYAGIAHLLAARAATVAREAGYRRAIHALMRESIHSANWSAQWATTIRRYALFGRALAP
jgi:hypothetical protein